MKTSKPLNGERTPLDEGLEYFWKMWRELETYKLVFGEIKDPYGKVDVMTAHRTYRENEDFHQNFGRYMEALRVKLETENK